MPPDARAADVLREAIDVALHRWAPPAALDDEPPIRLQRYATQIDSEGSEAEESGAGSIDGIRVEGWFAKPKDGHDEACARRHFIVAEVDLGASSTWFPRLLGVAAKVRSHLNAEEQTDLAMVLIGRPGSRAGGRAAVLERNESFAKVFVWSPSEDPSAWPNEAAQFATRLHLGPIAGLDGVASADLSPIDAIFQASQINADSRMKWQSILLNTSIQAAERARQLLEVVESPKGTTNGK